MPNYVKNRVQISGQKEEVQALINRVIKKIDQGRDYFDFSALIPKPESCEHWGEWRKENWGTSRGAFEYEQESLKQHAKSSVWEFKFETAWSVPIPIFIKLCDEYEVKLHVDSFDEGWNFATVIDGSGGKFNFEHIGMNEEIRLVEMYKRVFGRDPEIEE